MRSSGARPAGLASALRGIAEGGRNEAGNRLALGEPPAVVGRHQPEVILDAELARGVHRPVRVVERLARERHEVRAPFLQDLLGLAGMDDHAHRHGLPAGFRPEPLGIRHPVAVARRRHAAPGLRAPRTARFGLERASRASATRSARPSCRISSAWRGWTITPTAMVFTPASARSRSAYGTW